MACTALLNGFESLTRRGVACLIGSTLVLGWLGIRWLGGKSVEHGNVSFAVSPQGNLLVFAGADGDLYLFDLKTLRVTPFVHSGIPKSDPAFAPDGHEIAYSEGTGEKAGNHLFIRSLDGKQVRQLTRDAGVLDTQPCYSPDGKHLVFARAGRRRPYSMGGWTWDQYDLWVVNADGSHLQRITHQEYYQVGSPLFLAEKQQIVYGAYRNGLSALYVVAVRPGATPAPYGGRPEGGKQSGGAWASSPYLSHDGRRLAFISDRATPFEYDVLLMNADETGAQPLDVTSVSHYNQNPVFMPDGHRLLFLAGTESNSGSRPIFSLWEVNLANKKAYQIADSGLFTDPTHWKPRN